MNDPEVPNEKNTVAVVVLNRNKKYDLFECLDSIYSQDFEEFKIIIVDNASTDGSVEEIRIKYPSVFLISNKFNSGTGPGRNMGWKYAEQRIQYSYILFLDNDAVIEKEFIAKLVSVFNKNPQAGIVCGKAYTDRMQNRIMSAGIRANLFSGSVYDIGSGETDSGQYDHPGYVDACGSFAMMIRRDLFSSLDGFDDNFFPYGWEDVDLCLRAKKQGFLTFYSPDAVLIHKGSKLGRKPNPLYEKSKTKNYIYLIRSHATFLQKISSAVCLPFRAALLAAKLISTGNARIVLEHFKGFFIGINIMKFSFKSDK